MTIKTNGKKFWITPDVELISTINIQGGGQPSFHEHTMTGVFATPGGVKIGHIVNGPLASNGGLYNQANIS